MKKINHIDSIRSPIITEKAQLVKTIQLGITLIAELESAEAGNPGEEMTIE